MNAPIQQFLKDEAAVSAMEYALLAFLIAIVILGAIQIVGTQLLGLYNYVKDQITLAAQ